MRILLLSLVFVISAVTAKADEGAIQGVIQDQITAFKQDDFATAFTYASPNIRAMFGSSERFGMMVRNGYPMVWRPADVQFLELKTNPPQQDVMITDQTGALHVLRYYMVETENGWQINGVQVLEAPQIGA